MKEDIILEIQELFNSLRDNEYRNWCNRDTMTSWENSYEYSDYSAYNIQEAALIEKLEKLP